MPSTTELFSAARANWPHSRSSAVAKMTVKLNRVSFDVIPDLLYRFRSVSEQRICGHCRSGLDLRRETFECHVAPGRFCALYAKSSPAHSPTFGGTSSPRLSEPAPHPDQSAKGAAYLLLRLQ